MSESLDQVASFIFASSFSEGPQVGIELIVRCTWPTIVLPFHCLLLGGIVYTVPPPLVFPVQGK